MKRLNFPAYLHKHFFYSVRAVEPYRKAFCLAPEPIPCASIQLPQLVRIFPVAFIKIFQESDKHLFDRSLFLNRFRNSVDISQSRILVSCQRFYASPKIASENGQRGDDFLDIMHLFIPKPFTVFFFPIFSASYAARNYIDKNACKGRESRNQGSKDKGQINCRGAIHDSDPKAARADVPALPAARPQPERPP